MSTINEVLLHKARESLTGAASEFANGRYNNCANRCYYACFQAAVVALDRAGLRPSGKRDAWSHSFVQSQFAGHLINRRKVYLAELRDVLARAYTLRQTADYTLDLVSEAQAARMLWRTERLIAAVQGSGREQGGA